MATAIEDPRLGIGGNNPPPHETFKLHIDDLFETATGFLDGDPIATEGQAEAVSKLLDDARTAGKDADKQRAAEKKPHDDEAKAVQERWKPIIARAELTAETCKKALAPWLEARDAEMRAAALAAQREAEEKAAAARALHEQTGTDLAAREQAERALKDAARAERDANRADKAKAQATGGTRAVSLRSVWTATITDRRAALNYYLKTNPEAFVDVIQGLADHEARHGPRTSPGVEFTEQKVAV